MTVKHIKNYLQKKNAMYQVSAAHKRSSNLIKQTTWTRLFDQIIGMCMAFIIRWHLSKDAVVTDLSTRKNSASVFFRNRNLIFFVTNKNDIRFLLGRRLSLSSSRVEEKGSYQSSITSHGARCLDIPSSSKGTPSGRAAVWAGHTGAFCGRCCTLLARSRT